MRRRWSVWGWSGRTASGITGFINTRQLIVTLQNAGVTEEAVMHKESGLLVSAWEFRSRANRGVDSQDLSWRWAAVTGLCSYRTLRHLWNEFTLLMILMFFVLFCYELLKTGGLMFCQKGHQSFYRTQSTPGQFISVLHLLGLALPKMPLVPVRLPSLLSELALPAPASIPRPCSVANPLLQSTHLHRQLSPSQAGDHAALYWMVV